MSTEDSESSLFPQRSCFGGNPERTVLKKSEPLLAYSAVLMILKNLLIMHEGNTKEINLNLMSVFISDKDTAKFYIRFSRPKEF